MLEVFIIFFFFFVSFSLFVIRPPILAFWLSWYRFSFKCFFLFFRSELLIILRLVLRSLSIYSVNLLHITQNYKAAIEYNFKVYMHAHTHWIIYLYLFHSQLYLPSIKHYRFNVQNNKMLSLNWILLSYRKRALNTRRGNNFEQQ